MEALLEMPPKSSYPYGTVRLISTRLGPTIESDLDSRLDRGHSAVLLAGGPPSHSANKRMWRARALDTRFTVVAM
jgi:hypothetical protein